MEEKVFIGSDHGGLELKNKLKEFLASRGYKTVDIGPHSYNKDDDFPDYAEKVCKEVVASKGKGILICLTGQGMARAASKMPGIYPSLCWNVDIAKQDREHGNPNVLCISAMFTNQADAEKIADIWLSTEFSNADRHSRRIGKIKDIEKRHSVPT